MIIVFSFAGRVRTTRGHYMRQDVRELGLGPDTGGRRQGDQAHRTAARSEQSELRLLRPACFGHHRHGRAPASNHGARDKQDLSVTQQCRHTKKKNLKII